MISGVSMQNPKNFKDTASTVLINVIDFLLRKMEGGGESTIKPAPDQDPNISQPKRKSSLLFNTTNSPDGFNQQPYVQHTLT